MSTLDLTVKRPDRSSFKDGRALHDIYDDEGIKWIAKGQKLEKRQIEVAIVKGSLTKVVREKEYKFTASKSGAELRPTYQNIVQLTQELGELDAAKNEDVSRHGKLSDNTCQLINKNTDDIMELMWSTQFSPFKLAGLTSFLYHEPRFKSKRHHLRLLNNAGIQHLLFKSILTEDVDTLVKANLINPSQILESLAVGELNRNNVRVSRQQYQEYCVKAAKQGIAMIKGTELDKSFLRDLVNYFSPLLYFTSPEARLFQQINMYTNFNLPTSIQEKMSFKLSPLPMINLAAYFKPAKMGGGLGMEGSRLLQYVGLIPAGTALQFANREKGIIIAPKNKQTLYCVVITGMDGQPLISPSLREIAFADLGKKYNIIPSQELPLQYEQQSHEKIWRMHIVHEKLKKQLG